jgi:D-sedoheptulose 7-phosphate isomerase
MWVKNLDRHLDIVARLVGHLEHAFDPAATMLAEALVADQKILFCGNGGSACDAMHLAAELVVRFRNDRKAYAAIALSADSAIVTAGGNDYGYDRVFARQVEAYGRPNDVLVALSTSGKSRNVLEAILTARHRGLKTIGLSGKRAMGCDVDIQVPSEETARIQEAHILIGHLLIEELEERLPS